MEPEENEDVVAEVVREQQSARVVPIQKRIAAMGTEGTLLAECAERLESCVTPEGYLSLLPGVFGTDGFFIAQIEKVDG